MAERQSAVFNPDTMAFLVSRYGVEEPEDLAPILGFEPGLLRGWAEGWAQPRTEDAILLSFKTRLPVEAMTKASTPMRLAA